MSLTAFSLVCLAALLHAGWNLATKRAGASGAPFIWAVAVVSSVLWAPLALGVHGAEVTKLSLAAWTCIAASALIHVAYFLALLHAYRVADLSVVYPVARGSGPLAASLLALPLLGEVLGPWGAAGLGMIVAGTFMIAGGPALLSGAHSPRVMTGIGWGALTGLTIAAYTLNDGYAVRHLGVPPLLFDWLGILGRALLLTPWVWWARDELSPMLRRSWRVVVVVALLSPAAYILVLYAMTLAPVSRVAPARELSMLIATLFGARLLGEPDMWRRLAGAALIAAGVAALSLGR
jgi:drug/metabolite transporter (DMT)-like permease